jgi:PleD family two-component response regulator
LTISAGVAVSAGAGDTDGLLKAADEALYAAKSGGRNRVARAG